MFPESGKLKFTVDGLHNKGVSCLNVTSDSQLILTGGGDGKVSKVNE